MNKQPFHITVMPLHEVPSGQDSSLLRPFARKEFTVTSWYIKKKRCLGHCSGEKGLSEELHLHYTREVQSLFSCCVSIHLGAGIMGLLKFSYILTRAWSWNHDWHPVRLLTLVLSVYRVVFKAGKVVCPSSKGCSTNTGLKEEPLEEGLSRESRCAHTCISFFLLPDGDFQP